MTDRFQTRVAVHIVLIERGNIFLIRRDNTGYFDGSWGLPAGHLEEGEFPSRCASREAWEEIGIIPTEYEFIASMHHIKPPGNPTYTHHFFRFGGWTGSPRNAEPDKCSEANWFGISQLKDMDVIPYISHAIYGINNGVQYMEFTGP